MTEPELVTVTLAFTPQIAARLRALADPAWTERTIEAVLYELADHAQQGVYRPGSCERGWLVQALGDGWLVNVETDPEHADLGWQRPRVNPA